jgi:cyclopropane-fatty-acyl-phospholipid synthase
MLTDALLARGWIPDPVVRLGVRRAISTRFGQQQAAGDVGQTAWIETLRTSPIAIQTSAANAQHYEVPAAFYQHVLGRRLKYSCAYWPSGTADLDTAEEAMLALYEERADLHDGQRVLDLGCGWGSLSLWLAESHPRSRVLAVSNSLSQAAYIREQARHRGLGNVEVETADVATFEPAGRFDRVVSIEMFEHLRNWGAMFARVAEWLTPDGALFLHVFSHRRYSYPYEDAGPGDWMARHFFTGGMMPSHDLPRRFDANLVVEHDWRVSGRHYARTADAWLARMDANRARIMDVFRGCYGEEATRFWSYWRTFFIAVAELWATRAGREWIVSHHRLRPRRG